MFNLIVLASGIFMGQYHDNNSCQNAIKTIYFQRLAPYQQYLTQDELLEIHKTLIVVLKTQKEFICLPAKKS